MKIALLPGGFKPPHLGHYNMAKYLANYADKVIVRIGQKERDNIGKELANEIWHFYKEFDPDPLAKKLVISVASHPSPVRDVYDFVDQIAPEGSNLILGMGEKDVDDDRYSNIPQFAQPRNISTEIKLVPPQAGGISGTRMREIIKSNNKEEFFKYIPYFLPKEIKEEIWTKLQDTQQIEEFMMGTMNKQEMAKHNKNMKKLRKQLSKQGDQMIPVPTNLTKGLKRKLYEDNSYELFSKQWWQYKLIETFLIEGGAAGHMAHPFDLPNVKNGRDLIKIFQLAAKSLKQNPGSVKIDGVNASIRLINDGGERQFAMDRGSKKELDIKGVTKNDLEARFGQGHGMIKAGSEVLDIFNEALPSIQEELLGLGLWDDPNIIFNMEYVSGKSNVQDYGKKFLAIHGLLNIETKEVEGSRGILSKRVTTEKNFAQSDMDELIQKLEPFAKKRGFEIYGSVPTTLKTEPDFKSVLTKKYTIEFTEGKQTKTLAQWLSQVLSIPKTNKLTMNINGSTKDVGALSKQVYFAIFGSENVDDLFETEKEIETAIQGATTYLATEKLGDAILDVLDSPMGSVNDHEGVVIRDENISPNPFKITGKFITGGVSSQFQQKS
jgi:hypothetical protein